MALNDQTKPPVPSAAGDPPPADPPAPQMAAPVDDSVLLELALYTNYTWGKDSYVKGRAYRFTRRDAMILLGELDTGRPIWRVHRPKAQPRPQHMPVVDATEVRAVRSRQTIEEALGIPPPPDKRIDVGTDDEIEDILSRPDDDTGDVTV